MKTALTIAGSDSSGGAGIQADLKAMTMNGVYGMSAVTALTAQNTTGVTGILEVPPEFLKKQLDAVFSDIYPDAVKTGMVSSSELIYTIASSLREYKARNIVVDPVMVSTSGARLIAEEAVKTLEDELLPLALVATPNIPEAEILAGIKIQTEQDMAEAAGIIHSRFGCSVLVKGGHNINDANDVLCYGPDSFTWYYGQRVNNPNTHGTGCTLSSAIASNLAKGMSIDDAVRCGKAYVTGALSAMLDLGKGRGPMNHAFNLTGKFAGNKGLIARLMDSVSDVWPEYNKHPFVKGLETGSLDPEKFRHYIIQDYLYLNEYTKVFALGVTKAKSLGIMQLCSSIINSIAGVEMNIHNGYMGRLGVSQDEINRTARTPENLSYTSYMLRVAYDEGEAEILAAILSCALSYEDIAKKILENNPGAADHELYGDWIKCYSGGEYCRANRLLVSALEESAEDYTDSQLEHLAEIFRACSLYEMGFWDMAERGK